PRDQPFAATSILDDARPPLLPLRRRRLFDACRDGPDVPRRIDNPPGAIAPKLILHWKQNLRTGGHGPLDHGVHISDIDKDHHRRAAVRLWSTARQGGPLWRAVLHSRTAARLS